MEQLIHRQMKMQLIGTNNIQENSNSVTQNQNTTNENVLSNEVSNNVNVEGN